MNFNEILADFQFRASKIKKIEMNNEFSFLPDSGELETSININDIISRIDKDEEENLFIANLTLELNVTSKHKETNKKLVINIVIDGLFTFNKDNEDEFKQMLLLNGNSTLYSIARAHIITLSSMSLASGQIILPMINFLKLFELKKAKLKK